MQEVDRLIASRSLAEGARLPSIRQAAARFGVSKSTVVLAYDRLASEGVITPRRGAGFFVSSTNTPLRVSEVEPRVDRAVDPLWVSRQALETPGDAFRPGCGWLPAEWLPDGEIRRALRRLARTGDERLVEYGQPTGPRDLRLQLARRLSASGVGCEADQVLVTASATQAMDLVLRLLLSPGDRVLVDDPCFFNFLALLRAHRVEVIGLPMTSEGPDIAALEAALRQHQPKVYITTAGPQNPTGATLSLARAHRILKLAEQHELTIVEDDVFADFEDRPSPRLAALDGLERVIQIGSLSKTLSAAVRCGYVAVRRDWVDPLIDLTIATSYGSGRLSADLVLHVLQDPAYRRHLGTLRQRLAEARMRLGSELCEARVRLFHQPVSGMFLWGELPDDRDATAIARQALEQKVVLAPGNVFSTSQGARGYMRFNVAQCRSREDLARLRMLLGH
ncbi:PLP-dependent aminotransferase family protein [Qipengyuania sp. 6D47A]|uniref:PLP-dependent aminotransferase family protein n=2 Tax=Qipengyuania qiaonensis TaxID=2867240 RepID=A0ABS7J2W3_9SPHN|nr:PLP-dependent aminotransferase family protein [Qipengyuania qiaonensis]